MYRNGPYCSVKDEKIVQVIFQTIGDYPDEPTYQTLNVQNLKKILDNPALSLDLIRTLGFEYINFTNKMYLKFKGVSLYIDNEDKIQNMVQTEKISLMLFQYVLRACFRANKETKKTFDMNTMQMGVFFSRYSIPDNSENTRWENYTMSDKHQKTLCVKELCNVKHFSDWHKVSIIVGDNTGSKKHYNLTVLNNSGTYSVGMNWDEIDINTLMFDINNFAKIHKNNIDDTVSRIITTAKKYKQPIDFVKKSLHFFRLYVILDSIFEVCASFGSKHAHSVQTERYQLLSILRKHESVLPTSQYLGDNIFVRGLSPSHQYYVQNIFEPHAYRLKQSKKTCKKIKKKIFSKDSKHNYVWRCLLCNTFNQYRIYNQECPSCRSHCTANEKLVSISPLYCMESNCNKSISFCIDPCDKPFYIICDFSVNTNERNDENPIINKYREIEAMIQRKSNLKLSTIIVRANRVLYLIIFKKSNPLTLYELKHILYEIYMSEGVKSAINYTFIDVIFVPGNEKYPSATRSMLSKLSHDSKIDLSQPCCIDLKKMSFLTKPRTPVNFGKIQYDQGYYHSCIERIKNASVKNDNISNNISQGKLDTNKKIVPPFKAANATEVFDFEHTPSLPVLLRIRGEMKSVMDAENLSFQKPLVSLIKGVINNGYEEDLLRVNELNTKQERIDTIDKIVNEFLMKVQPLLWKTIKPEQALREFHKVMMILVRDLSKEYKIFDKDRFESKMFHSRHEMMGYPLPCVCILALMLYCDGECNYDLCKVQRKHQVMQKWPYFHCTLNTAIEMLSKFEIHYEHIYSGVCGVQLKTTEDVMCVHFQTNVSFSTDLNVALQFRGDSGMVIGLNMKRIVNLPLDGAPFRACDVSWISSLEDEKEILCEVHSAIMIYPHLVRNRDNTQWIVWVEDELNENIAFKSMFGSLAD